LCAEYRVRLFGALRGVPTVEAFGRQLEASGRARATIARRLCTIACLYRYAEEEGAIASSAAVHVRRPRLDYESDATGRSCYRHSTAPLLRVGVVVVSSAAGTRMGAVITRGTCARADVPFSV
jgi:hypothetical protein